MSIFIIYTCGSALYVCFFKGGLYNSIFGSYILCKIITFSCSMNYVDCEIWFYFLGILISWKITKLLEIVQFSYLKMKNFNLRLSLLFYDVFHLFI